MRNPFVWKRTEQPLCSNWGLPTAEEESEDLRLLLFRQPTRLGLDVGSVLDGENRRERTVSLRPSRPEFYA